MLSNTILAYAAGIFDGEGCVLIIRNENHFAVRITVSNTNEAMLQKMQEWFGGGTKILQSRAIQNKPCWEWRLCSKQAASFLKQIRPFTIIKSKQIDVALALADRIAEYNGRWMRKPGACRNSGLPVEEFEYRAALFQTLKSIRRGL